MIHSLRLSQCLYKGDSENQHGACVGRLKRENNGLTVCIYGTRNAFCPQQTLDWIELHMILKKTKYYISIFSDILEC